MFFSRRKRVMALFNTCPGIELTGKQISDIVGGGGTIYATLYFLEEEGFLSGEWGGYPRRLSYRKA